MAPEKMDRRVKRTRKLLLDTLTELLQEKDLKDITVKEMCEKCDLNRGTFYLHYKDVYDMMDQVQKDLFDSFHEILLENQYDWSDDTPCTVLYSIFTFIEKNRAIAKALMGPHGDYQFIMSLKQLAKDHISKAWLHNRFDMNHFEFFYSYTINGIIGLIQYWLETDSEKTPKEMAELITQMVLKELSLFAEI